MRYLLFNNITIDTHNQLLIHNEQSITLAPKVYDLLIYFCHNSQRVITKDELMDKVWTGTLVTENAISRTLVKVRKVLNDDPKQPVFIVTVPRKGYRMAVEFIASDEYKPAKHSQVEKPITKVKSNTAYSASNNKRIIYILISLLLVLIAAVYHLSSTDIAPITTKNIKPLTREVAVEQHPNLDYDLKRLAYTQIVSNQPSYLRLEDLTTHSKLTVKHPRANLSRPVWSPNNKNLAFLYQEGDTCTIFSALISDIDDLNSWQKISDCSNDSWPHITFSPNGHYLYFNDRQSITSGYQIFKVDLSNMKKSIVNQPITSGLGNYSFDISSDGKNLVMLNSEFEPTTSIYTLDLSESRLTKTAELPHLLRTVIWHHDNKTLVHPSPHPAYEIWQSDLTGEKLAVVASNTSRVKQVSRINNGQDFTFVSYLINRDIYLKGLQNNQIISNTALENSSVMDYLPALSNNGRKYAFVSKRNTTAEVYLASIEPNKPGDATAKQITFFNNPVKLYQLEFSPDDSQLMILADNQIFIVDLQTNAIELMPLKNMSINAVSWKDNNTLLLSTITNNNWLFTQYNINDDTQMSFSSDYQGGLYVAKHNAYYLISKNSGQVLKLKSVNSQPEPTGLFCSKSIINRQLNLKQTPLGLVCNTNKNNKAQLALYTFKDGSVQPWVELPTTVDFQVKKSNIITTKLTQSVADIMLTNSQ